MLNVTTCHYGWGRVHTTSRKRYAQVLYEWLHSVNWICPSFQHGDTKKIASNSLDQLIARCSAEQSAVLLCNLSGRVCNTESSDSAHNLASELPAGPSSRRRPLRRRQTILDYTHIAVVLEGA